MKIKKSIVSLLSISTLAFSFAGAASAQETNPLDKNKNEKFAMLDTTSTRATWGFWGKVKLDGKSITTLENSFVFGSGYAYALDGYQESGSLGTPTVVYRLYENKGGNNTSSVVWSETKTQNGYVYLSIPKDKIDPKKGYKLEAENLSNFQVELRGNAYTSSH